MKKTVCFIGLLLMLALSLSAELMQVGFGQNSIAVLSNSENEALLQYNISQFEKTKVEINGSEWYHIRLPKEGITQDKGFPELPVFNRSVIIPNQSLMKLDVFDVQYQDIQLDIAPSKGVITRDIDPATVPYTFETVYSGKDFYPLKVAELSEPYILRDFRAVTVKTIPFAYNPDTHTLRIYTSYKIRIYADGADTKNTISRSQNTISRDFLPIYENHFVNFNSYRYTPVSDSFGKLLVICHTNYLSQIALYVNWKKQKGINTELVEWSTIGTTAAQLQTYIQNRYNADNNITYVQLVGDAPQIPTLSSGGGGSDPTFALVAGSDNYPDIFIGRFSAETTAQVTAQVNKAIVYERDLNTTATWLSTAIGISDAATTLGDDSETDIAHMNNIRTKLMNYGYSTVDQIYEPSATAAQVTANVNTGRGFINYVGHGSDTSWVTSGFNNTNATALTNGSKTPFIMDVACVNGNFVSITCFAEAWMRNANGGSVAIYASSINQSWSSPMRAQDHLTDLMVAETKTTTGGLYYNASCNMMDIYGTDGVNMYKTWHVFGDAALTVRTKTPIAMSVTHPATIVTGASSVTVNTGVANARVAITYNNTIYGVATANSSGAATVALANALTGAVTYSVTATAFNRVTYVGTLQQVAGTGPYMTVETATYTDSNNNVAEYNESGSFNVAFKNIGSAAATNVSTTLSCSTVGITITDNSETIASLAANTSTTINNAYSFNIANNLTNGTVASFTVTMSAGSETWTHNFSLTINAPALAFGSITISDPAPGNNNGRLDPGETVTITMPLSNNGNATSTSGAATLSCATTGITVNTNSINFTAITAAGSANLSFYVSAASGMSNGVLANFIFNATAGAYNAQNNTSLEVGSPTVITIGNGTSSQSYPIDRYYNYSAHEAIYLASEIGMAGMIKSIGYYKSSGTDVNSIVSVTIYMKNTTATTLTTGTYSTSGYTQVYSGVFPNSSTSGWMSVDLNTQFSHNGTNLSVLVVKGNQAWISSYPLWTYSVTTSSRARQSRDDYTAPTSLSATTNLPNLQLKMFPPVQTDYANIASNPTSVSQTVNTGASASTQITLSNSGNIPLIWSSSDREEELRITNELSQSFGSQRTTWLSYSPASGTIAAGGNVVINLTLNSNGLAGGTYNKNITITSNASNSPTLSIPISFTVSDLVPNQPRFVAEWEPATGAIIRYPFGIPYTLISDLSNNGLLYVIVTSASQTTCNTALSSNGVNMANVRYINAATDSYWTRDYGPWTIFDANNNMKIVDFTYNRPRPNDDVLPTTIANYLGITAYPFAVSHTGGNIMTDGMGKAMSTDLVLSENTGLTQAQINGMFQTYLGVTDYQLYPDPNNTYIDHIDCWAKLLDVDKVIIRRVPSSHAQYSAIEAVVNTWRTKTSSFGTPYKIYRVDTPNDEPYSNSFILNSKIYVPQMGTANDAAALTTYRNAMPGWTVTGFAYSTFESTDAIHCRVNTVFDAQMVSVKHVVPAGATANQSLVINADIAHANPLNTSQTYLAWKAGFAGVWQNSSLSYVSGNSWTSTITAPAYGDTLYYWFKATDTTARSTSLPLCAASDPFKLIVNIPSNTPNWQPVSYGNTPATLNAAITINNIPANVNDMVGAFVGNECRGSGQISSISRTTANTSLQVNLSGSETVNFKVYSYAMDTVYPVQEVLPMQPGMVYGDGSPIPLNGTSNLVLAVPSVQILATGASIQITWNAVPHADIYNVFYCTEPNGTYSFAGSTANLSWTASPIAATMFYKVVAIKN